MTTPLQPVATDGRPAPSARGSWPAVLVCVALNVSVFIAIAVERPEYLRDYQQTTNPDAIDYVTLGRNFLLKGCYSRSPRPPHPSDVLRTPIYPLFAGGLDVLGGAGCIYLTQALLHVWGCVLLYAIVRQYFGPRAALAASLLLATDLMLVVSNFETMSEPLFTFLLVAASALLLPAVIPVGSPRPAGAGRIAAGGVLLALATLTRPAGLYLPLIFVVVVLGRGIAFRQLYPAVRSAGILLLIYIVLVGSWIGRNYVLFGLPRLSNADAVMLVYFAGAGAYQVEHGLSLDEAQDQISREYDLSPPLHTNNHWIADRPVAQMDAELRAVTRPVLLKYPKSLVVSSISAVVKASYSHNVAQMAALFGKTWSKPGTTALLRLDRTALDRLGENGPVLVAALVWQLVHTILILGLFAFGVIAAIRRRQTRPITLVLLLVLGYFLLTVAVVGPEAYSRSRTPHLPFLFALAGAAFCRTGFVIRTQPEATT